MEVNDLRVQEHAAKKLQRAPWPGLALLVICPEVWEPPEERTRMAQEDEEGKEQRARDRIRSLCMQIGIDHAEHDVDICCEGLNRPVEIVHPEVGD